MDPQTPLDPKANFSEPGIAPGEGGVGGGGVGVFLKVVSSSFKVFLWFLGEKKKTCQATATTGDFQCVSFFPFALCNLLKFSRGFERSRKTL